MRVRTYGFPGVLRGLPGPRLAATPRSRPRRSLSSPGVSCTQQSRGFVSVATWGRRRSSTRPGWVRRRGSASGRASSRATPSRSRSAATPSSRSPSSCSGMPSGRSTSSASARRRTSPSARGRRSVQPIPGCSTSCSQLRGSCAVEQDDRSAVAGPGQLVAWQSSSPYAIEGLEPFEALIVRLPRQAAREGDRPLDGRAAGEHLRRRADRPQLPHRPVRHRPGRGRRRAGPFAPRAQHRRADPGPVRRGGRPGDAVWARHGGPAPRDLLVHRRESRRPGAGRRVDR